MRISIRKVHKYLNILLDYSVQGEVSVRMEKYVVVIIKDFPEDITLSMVTLAEDHLFDVNKTTVRLNEAEGRAFRREMARLLLLCKRSRPYIHNAVAFPTKRFK